MLIRSDKLPYKTLNIWRINIDRTIFFSANCRRPLGMASGEIRNEQITASSAFNNDYSTFGAHRARLNLTSWPPGYRADSKQDTGWIKVELEKKMVITAIATQGYGDSSVEEWISRYMVMFSNGGDFMYFKDLDGNLQVCFVLYRLPINSTCTVC